MEIQKDINQLTTQELEAYLAARKKEEGKADMKKRRQYQKEKDDFVFGMVERMTMINGLLTELKKEAIEQGRILHAKNFEIRGMKEKEQKQFSIHSEDGSCKLVIESSDKKGFNETAIVAIERLKQFFETKFRSRNKLLYDLLNELLMKNKQGDYDPMLVQKLRKKEAEVNDTEFSKALDELDQASYVTGSALYVRGFKLNPLTKKMEPINLSFASM